jgi:hypothetical protein
MEGVYGSIYTVQNGPSKVLESCGAARRRVETVGDIKHHTCEGAFLVVSHNRHFSSGLNMYSMFYTTLRVVWATP